MSGYALFRFYSVELGCNAVRVSMVDDNNAEHWIIIPDGGKGFRQRRNEAIEMIDAAIAEGEEPGEVAVWRETA